MKLAVISDIHSNIQALEAVMEEIEAEGPDYVLCLGDLVGYGANPNEVVEEIRSLDNLICVKGNHDAAVVTENASGLNPAASKAVEWTVERIDEGNRAFLEGLQEYNALELDELHFFLVHGSPDDYLNDYVYEDAPEERLESFFEEIGAHVLLMGHTHIPFFKEVGVRSVINPGSVGQPRDKDRRASFTLIDTRNMEVENRRVSYDVKEAAEAIKKTSIPDGLAERLYYGR